MDKAESDRKNKMGEKADTEPAKKKGFYEEIYDSNKAIDVKSAWTTTSI